MPAALLRHAALIAVCVLFCSATPLSGQAGREIPRQSARSNEGVAARRFESIRVDPLAVHAFLATMPKGADLHTHLAGAVYAETLIQEAAEDLLCADPVRLILVRNVGTTRSIPPRPVCAEGAVPASSAFSNGLLYDGLVNSFSMRSFVPSAGVSAHDHFFAAFDHFISVASSHAGEWLDEVAKRAAAQNEQYLEVMVTPDFSLAHKLAVDHPWEGDPAKLREALLAAGLREAVAANRAELDAMERSRREREHCGTAEAVPACGITVRYLYQVLRAFPPEQVFAQTLLGYEVASADSRMVGVNLVQPEDAFPVMSQYETQMRMLAYLHTVYPKVHLSLHAGELAPGLVPPEGLRFHIRQAVEVAGAERIGHGIDAMLEDDPYALLQTMARRHIMVEINLTSNDVILRVSGAQHPLHSYLAAHVPVALSTDDEGVARTDLTQEYARAVADQQLTYAQLKDSARTGLEHAFLPGESLWRAPDNFHDMQRACAASRDVPSTACALFLRASEKAAQQWELERRFRVFEAAQAATVTGQAKGK